MADAQKAAQLQRIMCYVFHLFTIAYSVNHTWLPDIHSFIIYIGTRAEDFDEMSSTDMTDFVLYCQMVFKAIFVEPIALVQDMAVKYKTNTRPMSKCVRERLMLDLIAAEYNRLFYGFCSEHNKQDLFVPFIMPPCIPAKRTVEVLQFYGFSEEKQEKSNGKG